MVWVLAAGLAAFVPWLHGREDERSPFARRPSAGIALGAALPALAVVIGLLGAGPVARGGRVEFDGRDGVVEIEAGGRVFIDGLWHSVLFRDGDLAVKRTPNVRRKMLIALLPYLAHEGNGPLEVLNIGMGTGATARTLAKSTAVASVDAYEINGTLRDVIAAFPEESLGSAHRDKIRVLWEDARTGLVRRDRKYDVITQSPLYLKQAGSSFLLSKQYFELLRSRLKDGGIVGIYCNAQGNAEQALLVRKTVAAVFPFQESYGGGYFILASNRPIVLTRESFGRKLVDGDPVADDIRLLGIDAILAGIDRPRLDWESSPWIVTDDHPLVEHPTITRWLFRRP